MSHESVERRLTTILAADVVGYSRLMGDDEAGTLAALNATRKELIEPKAKQYHGRPRKHDRQVPHGARHAKITKSPGTTLLTFAPIFSTNPAASWPKRNGKSSVIAPSR